MLDIFLYRECVEVKIDESSRLLNRCHARDVRTILSGIANDQRRP